MRKSSLFEVFRHCPGIGPMREKELWSMGINTWEDWSRAFPFQKGNVLFNPRIYAVIQAGLNAYQNGDIQFFIERYPKCHHWRILQEYQSRLSFFDIETNGLDPLERHITVLSCLHKGKMHTFVEGENLDDFLDLLEEIEILVSFNGSSFDVPVVLDHFCIPFLPCVHLDLRWIAFHQGLKGGLKYIERKLGRGRPGAIVDIDGWEAIRLWESYVSYGNEEALVELKSYCEEDVRSLEFLSQKILAVPGKIFEFPESRDETLESSFLPFPISLQERILWQ